MPVLEVKVIANGAVSVESINILMRMTVAQVINTLRANVRLLRLLPENEYSLMTFDCSREVWFLADKEIGFYLSRNPSGMVEYRHNPRLVQFKMRIGIVTTVEYACSQSANFIIRSFCQKIGIKNFKEYFLMREQSTDQLCHNKGVNSRLVKLNLENNKTWLNGQLTLPEQGILPNETLLLERRLYLNDYIPTSMIEIDILYDHVSNNIISGTVHVDSKTAVRLAAFQCQINMGDYHDSFNRSNVLNYVPEMYRKYKNKVIEHYKLLRGSEEQHIKAEYVIECQSQTIYGASFFAVQEINVKLGKLAYRLLCISKNYIRIIKLNNQVKHEWPISCVRKYGFSDNKVIFDLGHEKYCILTKEGKNISFLLKNYILKNQSPEVSTENSISTITSLNNENYENINGYNSLTYDSLTRVN